MKLEELLAKLQDNAATAAKPVAVEVDGVGTVHIRRRTVLEFEQIAALKLTENKGPAGIFAASLARLLCDEEGNRFPAAEADTLAALLSQQPDDVFQKLMEATDGGKKETTVEVTADPN